LIEVLVISGPAGVGKTSVANEVSAQLRAADIAHAVIDTDALDDVYPVPDEQWQLTERNLASVWQSFRELGTRRLILAGVYMHRESELSWIRRASGAERLLLVRLSASERTLGERVGRREIGSEHDDQLARTLLQANRLAEEAVPQAPVIETDGRTVPDIAAEIVELLGWA
jgi:broad-specificity NMP kinase